MSKHSALAIMIFIAITVIAIATASASAQVTSGVDNSGSLPISLFINKAISAHEQDIKDRMFDYEFNQTASEAERASIVKERTDELNAAALDNQAFLKALKNESSRGLISSGRLDAMLNATKDSIERIAISSNRLQEKAQKIKGHDIAGTVNPLISNINGASLLADNISKGARTRNNTDTTTPNKPPQQSGNHTINK